MAVRWRVHELAAQRGISGARQLAQIAGLDEKTVRNILSGRAGRVDLETIAKLSNALNVTPGSLWVLDRDDPWARSAGSLRSAPPSEVEQILDGEWNDVPDPALERGTRTSR